MLQISDDGSIDSSLYTRDSESEGGKVEKSCALYQKDGGTHTTHNTGECRKYDKDGALQKSFSRKAAIGQKRHGSSEEETSNSFMQIMERFSSLEKTVKKTQKSAPKEDASPGKQRL
jgi:hypothetical protein